MKKVLALLFVMFMVSGISLCALGFSLGFRAGAMYNTIRTDNNLAFGKNDYIWGGNLSGVVVIDLFKFLGLQIEAGYSCRNGLEYNFFGQKTTLSVSSVDVPMMLKLRLPMGFNINGGVQVSFLTGEVTRKVGGSVTHESIRSANLNEVLWGFVAGIDFGVPIGKKGKLFFDGRFAMDFNKIGDDSSRLAERMSFTPSVGYLFTF